MGVEVGRDALRLGARLNSGSCGIVFFGGEPLLRMDLIRELVAEGGRMTGRGEGRFHFKITTNGLRLDERLLDFAQEHDMLVAMSFDGIAPAHDRHRRAPDGSATFDRLLPKLRLLLAARPYASIFLVVNPDTVNWQTTGSTARVSPVLCRVEQMLVTIADDVGARLFAENNRRFLQKHYDPSYPFRSLLEDLSL
jgi:uncharacterized protein